MKNRCCRGARGTRFWGYALVALALALLAVLIVPREAAAHAAYQRSDPAANGIVATSPTQITIWFTEPLEMEYSSATLYDQLGAAVPGAVSGPGPNDHSLAVPIPATLANGTYSVAFTSLSAADGHGDDGYFAFTVGTAADVTTVVAPDSGSGSGSL
ncbi:MAG: copper resistance protein CopC, partial [Chloroflexota bacterium]|nr:copper resistance protein CopC [Chloroflexota bacterium]